MKPTTLKLLLRAEWDRALAYLLIAAGASLVLVGWVGVSGTPFVADQLSYLASGGVGGLFLLALGLALLMSADHHDEWRKLDSIEAALREPAAGTTAAPSIRPAPAPVLMPAQSAPSRAAEGRARGLAMLSVGGVVAAVIMVIGWAHSSGDGRQGVAAEGLTLSIAGLLVAVAAVAAFLMPSRTRLATRRAHLLRGFVLADAGGGQASTNGGGDVVLVAGGLSRYHRPGCPAVNGLATMPTRLSALTTDLKPCDLCATGEQQ